MILGFAGLLVARESHDSKIFTQHAQGFFHQETREIPGTIGHEFAAADADEQRVKLIIDFNGRCGARGESEHGHRDRKLVPVLDRIGHTGDRVQHVLAGRLAQQRREDAIGNRTVVVISRLLRVIGLARVFDGPVGGGRAAATLHIKFG